MHKIFQHVLIGKQNNLKQLFISETFLLSKTLLLPRMLHITRNCYNHGNTKALNYEIKLEPAVKNNAIRRMRGSEISVVNVPSAIRVESSKYPEVHHSQQAAIHVFLPF